MRIAILSDVLHPYHHGGSQRVHFERAIRLARRGHEVVVYTMHWWPQPQPEIQQEGARVQAIMPKVELYTHRGRRAIRQSLTFGLATFRLFRARPFDILAIDQFPFLHFFPARVICWLLRRPLVATWHEVWSAAYWRHYMGWLGPLGFLLQRLVVRLPDFWITDSVFTAERLNAELGIPSRRMLALPPCGVETLEGGMVDEPLPTPPVFDCVFVGRLLPHKNVDVLIQAVATLANVTCLILGRGPERERLERLAESLGVGARVRFESPPDQIELFARLKTARLFVLPSTREGFGIAVWEANACGLPALVVRHRDNAALELVAPGNNGLVCDPGPDQMAAAIRGYLADPQEQQRMRRLAITNAARYSWESHVSRLEQLYRDLCGEAAEEPSRKVA